MVIIPLTTKDDVKQLLRIDGTDYDPILDQILPAVDQYVLDATGNDFTGDPLAKMVANMLTIIWFENPSMIGKADEGNYGLTNFIKQLQTKALPDVTEPTTTTPIWW